MERRFVDVKTLATLIPLKPSMIYKLAKGREMPHYRIGGKIMFRIDEVYDWIGKFKIEEVSL